MTTLGISGAPETSDAREESAKSTLRAEFAKRIAFGGGWSIGAAIVFGAFEILRADPHDAFPLLMSWGPKAIGSLVAIYVLYDLAKIILKIVERFARSFEKMAIGLQKIGDKDDRQVQEMQTLTSYTAQQSERSYAMISGLSEGLEAMNKKLDAVLQQGKRDQ